MAVPSLADLRVAVLGLGYVGLPLALALARRFPTVGFDIDEGRIGELGTGHDRTGEVESAALRAGILAVSSDPAVLADRNLFIVAAPTPVDDNKRPDLSALLAACRTVGAALKPGAVVVLESTVYPGVTEDLCGPELARVSGLAGGSDFLLGYSPERINPGDRAHSVDQIPKVVAGQTPDVAAFLAEVYGAVTTGGVHVARDIKTAEAAKAIENAQRDINIAFVNEVAQITARLGISIHDVLETAGTKWNFLGFQPGLVGGHCIGVDPYYLAHCAQALGHDSEIILAGRRINDGMAAFIAERLDADLAPRLAGGRGWILVLGLTFKEDVPDLRNSKSIDLVAALRAKGHHVDVHDPMADPAEARALCGLDIIAGLDSATGYDAVIGAVAHRGYRELPAAALARMLKPGGTVADIKGQWRHLDLPSGLHRWQL